MCGLSQNFFQKGAREGGAPHPDIILELIKMHILLMCVFLPKIAKGTREVTQTMQFILDGLMKIVFGPNAEPKFLTFIGLCGVGTDPGKLCQARVRLLHTTVVPWFAYLFLYTTLFLGSARTPQTTN